MRQDYILDENFDLVIKNNDLFISKSSANHKAVMLWSDKGMIRNYVKIGVGISSEINGVLDQKLRRNILATFKQDGYSVKGITFEGGKINIP